MGKEEVKLPSFADDIILYVERFHTHSQKNMLQLINQFSKIAEYIINTQKPVALLYISNKHSEKEIRKAILIYIYICIKNIHTKE